MRATKPSFTDRTPRALLALSSVALIGCCVAACGAGAAVSPSAAAAHNSPTPTATLDRCVVGTWKSTGVTGTVSYSQSLSVPITGGGGDVMTIHPDGNFSTDYSNDVPQTGTGSDGAQYAVTTTGVLDGRLTTAGGQFTQILTSASSMTITVTRNGASFRGGSLVSPQTSGYVCTPGKSLSLTQAGVTESWVPS